MASTSPSSSASPSPSAVITGKQHEVIAVEQDDELTITTAPTDSIEIVKQLDTFTILEEEDISITRSSGN